MGKYTTKALDAKEYKNLIDTIRKGYTHNGSHHKPNNQVADILVLEANLGCRLGDIVSLNKDSFVCEAGIWKINIEEEKTGKRRVFIVPKETKAFIDRIEGVYSEGKNLFTISKQAVWKALRNVTAYLGLDNVSSHSLRKFAAMNVYTASDYDIELTCAFLQHTSTSTTRTYIRRSSKQMEDTISKIVNLA